MPDDKIPGPDRNYGENRQGGAFLPSEQVARIERCEIPSFIDRACPGFRFAYRGYTLLRSTPGNLKKAGVDRRLAQIQTVKP